jgi:hypothetical protein
MGQGGEGGRDEYGGPSGRSWGRAVWCVGSRVGRWSRRRLSRADVTVSVTGMTRFGNFRDCIVDGITFVPFGGPKQSTQPTPQLL